MSSAICFNLDQSKILLSVTGLKNVSIMDLYLCDDSLGIMNHEYA